MRGVSLILHEFSETMHIIFISLLGLATSPQCNNVFCKLCLSIIPFSCFYQNNEGTGNKCLYLDKCMFCPCFPDLFQSYHGSGGARGQINKSCMFSIIFQFCFCCSMQSVTDMLSQQSFCDLTIGSRRAIEY